MANRIRNINAISIINIITFIRTLFLLPHGTCKYQPSCTVYAKEALLNMPFHKAVYAIVCRVVRCNPFSKGGYDPVIKSNLNNRGVNFE